MTLEKLYRCSPYNNFDFKSYPKDLQGWGSEDPNFDLLLKEKLPKFIIEVGTWKGGSAIHMAKLLKKYKVHDPKVICVDTWLGSLEFWSRGEMKQEYFEELNSMLQIKHGLPTVYFQFLANVMYEGLDDVIIPFPQTSQIAAAFFNQENIFADMIYLDGSHDKKSVLEDMKNYWKILADGGVLFGDDYHNFHGIREAVEEFSNEKGRRFEISESGRQWVFYK